MNATLYYNPRCGTCQKVRASLEARGYRLTLIEYLKTPPSPAELDLVLNQLGMAPEDIVRTKEPAYARWAGKKMTREQWLTVLHENPELIQRPIVVIGGRALIARPPEALAAFLDGL